MRTIIVLLAAFGVGLLSIALAKGIGSVPIAWAVGFITNGLFRLMDGPAVKWIKRA